ncbi:hypothetical protein Drorol1_Dr00015316 [Drosera rotundifolia]
MAVVFDQSHGFKPLMQSQICRLPSFTHLDHVMLAASKIDLADSSRQVVRVGGFHRSVSTPCLTLDPRADENLSSNPRVEIIGGKSVPRARALMAEVAIGLASGADPVPVSSGLGGVYLMCDRKGDPIAVAKPVDEEPLALNNPKGFTGRKLGQSGLKRSVRIGETGMRELAAYLLDHAGFAGVPTTALVKIFHVEFNVNPSAYPAAPYKIASLQRHVEHDCDAGDLGPSSFSVSSVHCIGILDVRLLNIDRHSGNILVKKHGREGCPLWEAKLVPIDHGLCLPEWLDNPYFEWLHWPQAAVPFSESELEYISKLDPLEDAKLLRTELPGLSEASIRVLVVCTIFLKRSAAAGLTLAEIGEMLTRECHGGEETMSVLENICAQAKYSLSNMPSNDVCGSVTGETSDEDPQIFQYDVECGGDTCHYGLDSSPANYTFTVKSSKMPRYSWARSKSKSPAILLAPLFHDEDRISDNEVEKEICQDNHRAGHFTKSFSFDGPNLWKEPGVVMLGDMNDEKWNFFLDAFEKLLPDMFRTRKSSASTLRLGTSCRF